MLAHLKGKEFVAPPTTTAFGAMRRHLRQDGVLSNYVLVTSNWSFFDPIEKNYPNVVMKEGDELGNLSVINV